MYLSCYCWYCCEQKPIWNDDWLRNDTLSNSSSDFGRKSDCCRFDGNAWSKHSMSCKKIYFHRHIFQWQYVAITNPFGDACSLNEFERLSILGAKTTYAQKESERERESESCFQWKLFGAENCLSNQFDVEYSSFIFDYIRILWHFIYVPWII